jgi:phosphoglycolate phosphatase
LRNDDAIILEGDTRHDAEGAKEVNIAFVGVTYGYEFKSEEDFFGLPYLEAASNGDELKKILLRRCCDETN